MVTTGLAANATLDALRTASGATPFLMIYNNVGAIPVKSAGAFQSATLNGATLLASLPCTANLGSATAAGVLTFGAITATAAVAGSGATPGFFRICTSNADGGGGANCVAQGSAGLSGADLNFSSTISSGGTVSVSSLTVTNPIYANAS